MKIQYPTISELFELCKAVKHDISDEFRVTDDSEDDCPGIQLTVACDEKGWNFQTGDNSFSGGAYGHRHWAVVGVYRASNCKELAREILNELKDLAAHDEESS